LSLSSAQLIAFSGLSATQVQISIATSNISNADTAGYTEQTANQVATVTGTVGSGVAINGITTIIDKLLMQSLVGATSGLGSANTTNNYLNQLQKLFGTVGGSINPDGSTTGTSIANLLASFESALSSLAGDPASASLQSNAISALGQVTTLMNQTSSGIQQLRGNADQAIASSVQNVNSDLQQIASLNAQIKQLAATGQPTAQLEDQRSTALQDIASKMNVNYFTNGNGDIQIYTTSGQPLLDNSVHQLSYTAAPTVMASTTYSPTPPSGFSGIMVNGVDITSQITSGNIGALVTLRDKTLANTQSQLDQLATQLTSSLNAVSNQGTAMPPPSSLTGTAAVNSAGTDPFSGTGTVRLAVTNSSGNLVSYQDLNLGSYTTVGALVSAINSGTSGLTASVSSGQLVITAPSGDGVAINEMTSSVGSGGQGFSDYFGLNDLLTGSGASNIAVRSNILAGTAGLPSATLDNSATLTAGNSVLSSGSAAVDNGLYDAMTQQTNFGAVGGLTATTTTFANYAASIVSYVATGASQASSNYTLQQTTQSTYANSLSSESGVNIDQETARITTLQNKYSATSELIQAINTMFNSLVTAMQSI
jgi:flagellar hook-associated protein 1